MPKELGSRLIGLAVETYWIAKTQIEPILIYHGFCKDAARELGVVNDYVCSSQKRSGKWRDLLEMLRGSKMNQP